MSELSILSSFGKPEEDSTRFNEEGEEDEEDEDEDGPLRELDREQPINGTTKRNGVNERKMKE
jgi:hypothetical protein